MPTIPNRFFGLAMLKRVVLSALIIATVLTGCANPHAHRPAAGMRPGDTPNTTEVKYEAVYALHRTGNEGPALHSTRLVRGEQVGFRREADGSAVAVSGGQSIPLTDGCYEWVLVEGSAPRWSERAMQDCRRAATGVSSGFLLGGLLLAALAVVGACVGAAA